MVETMSRMVGSLIALVLLLTVPTTGLAQDEQPHTLTIFLRDLGGTPLEGAEIRLYSVPRDFNTLVDHQTTGTDGAARFPLVEPGDYQIAFHGSIGRAPFVRSDRQNGGAMAGSEGGGFGLHLDAETLDYVFRFVAIQSEKGSLVPFLDISEGPNSAPEPYLYNGSTSDEVILKIDPEQTLVLQPLFPTATEMTAPQGSEEERAVAPSRRGVFGLVLGIVLSAGALIAMWSILIIQSRRNS
jgi:hypothetical protein